MKIAEIIICLIYGVIFSIILTIFATIIHIIIDTLSDIYDGIKFIYDTPKKILEIMNEEEIKCCK